jgi:hypothetical protein
MKILSTAALTMILGFMSLPVQAMSITYDVNRVVDAGTVVGTITTDGTHGALSTANITAWDLALDDGSDTFNLNSAAANNVLVMIGSPLSADADGLYINWDADGFVDFRFVDDPALIWRWLMDTNSFGPFRAEQLLHNVNGVEIHKQDTGRPSGVERLATAQTSALPEPGTFGLVLVGLAGMAWIRRRKIA